MADVSRSIPELQGHLSTLDRQGRHRWVHPVVSRGRYYYARLVVAVALMALFLGLPHIRIAGKPAFLMDLSGAQFHLLGTTFFPTDTLLLPFFGVAVVLGIGLFTALYGRIWCGWACPQTVYMEFVFRPIETLFEGPANRRSRQAHAKPTASLLLRRAAKWCVYLLIAGSLATAFLAYFVDTGSLWAMLRSDPRQNWAAFLTVAIVAALILFDFTYFREQTCIIACPYGRLQSVLIDAQSLIVGYDVSRGEPRAKPKHRSSTVGDCVDCGGCVRTCPTGIDIRQGLQLECIGCTQCVDACDPVMDKVGRPRGLIRYTSLEELEGSKRKVLRPRVMIYLAIALAAAAVLVVLLSRRSSFDVELMRKPGTPFYLQSDGRVVNRVRMRITNQTTAQQSFAVELLSPADAALVLGEKPVVVDANGVKPVEVLMMVPPDAFKAGRAEALLRFVDSSGAAQEKPFVLLGPLGAAP